MGNVIRAFLKSLRIPFATQNGEEVSTIDKDSRGDLFERIGNRVDNRFPEGGDVFGIGGLGATAVSPLSPRRKKAFSSRPP